jgi:hypothetical protein
VGRAAGREGAGDDCDKMDDDDDDDDDVRDYFYNIFTMTASLILVHHCHPDAPSRPWRSVSRS